MGYIGMSYPSLPLSLSLVYPSTTGHLSLRRMIENSLRISLIHFNHVKGQGQHLLAAVNYSWEVAGEPSVEDTPVVPTSDLVIKRSLMNQLKMVGPGTLRSHCSDDLGCDVWPPQAQTFFFVHTLTTGVFPYDAHWLQFHQGSIVLHPLKC